MELIEKQGFKQTEVGLIPEDWKVLNFGELFVVIGGGTFKSRDKVSDGAKWLKIANVGIKEIKWNELEYLPISFLDEYKTFLLKENDVVMALTRPILNKKLKVSKLSRNDVPCLLNQRVGKIEPINENSLNWIYHLLQSNKSINGLLDSMAGTDPPNLSNKGIYGIKIAVPPTIEEQNAIATALSDVDELISNLNQLITKKKAIKQGTMQQLLTPPHKGGKRLDGFSGEWVEKKLGEVTNIKTGTRNNQDKIEEGLYPFFVRSQTIESINNYSYDCEAILVPGEGGIGSIFHYINGKFEVHQRVYKISDFIENVVGKYIYLQMRHSFGKHAMTNSVKATVDSLRLPTFQEFIVPIPTSKEEQIAIAEIITNMEIEIEQLESKKAKYQTIKQGMMQELLTGKTRLV